MSFDMVTCDDYVMCDKQYCGDVSRCQHTVHFTLEGYVVDGIEEMGMLFTSYSNVACQRI